MDVRSFAPPRSVEDILAERVRLVIGGEAYVLPALSIAANEAWKAGLEGDFVNLMTALQTAGDDVPAIVAILTRDPDWLIDHLIGYDRSGILPDRAHLREGLTPLGVLRAVVEVWQAANPLADIGTLGFAMTGTPSSDTPPPSSSPRRPTAGRRARSARG